MKLRASFLLALRFLLPVNGVQNSNARKSLFGAVLCIGLSLVPLVVVLVVSNGMIQGITERIIQLSSFHIQVVRHSGERSAAQLKAELSSLEEEIVSLPGITGTVTELQGLGLAAGKTARSGVTIRAVPPDLFTGENPFTRLFTVSDGVLHFTDAKSTLIGKKLAQTIGVKAGDTIRLITAKTGETVIPRVTTVKVSGIISCGYQELDALWVFLPLESGFDVLSGTNARSLIGVQTEDPFSPRLGSQVYLVDSVLPAGYAAYTWKDLNAAQYENFESTRVMLLFIMFLIVLVASVNVSAALVMLVMERRKEIAVLKSTGASSQGIVAVFILAGVITGTAGVALGIPFGLLCAVNINSIIAFIEKAVNFFSYSLYIIRTGFFSGGEEFIPLHLLDPAFYLEKVPIAVPFVELFVIAAGTIVLSALVSFGPALRSGREKPLAILRKF